MKRNLIKKVLGFVRQYWGVLVFSVIVFLTILFNSNNIGHLLSNDNYSPELNSSLTITRVLETPAWRSYRGLGVASDSEQSDIFRAGIFWVLDFFVESSNIRVIYYFAMMILGGYFIGLLASEIFKQTDRGKYTQIIFLFSSLTYISSLWTIWLFYQNITPFINNFGFYPILLYTTYRYLHKPAPNKLLALFIVALLLSSTALVATLFITDIFFYLLFIVFFILLINRKIKWKLFKIGIKPFGIVLIANLFWILPFIFYSFSNSSDVVDSYVNRTITSSVIDLERETQTAENSARFYSRIISEDNEEWLKFPLSEMYIKNDLYKFLGLLPALFTLVLIVSLIVKKKFVYLFPVTLVLFSWFIIKVDNPPFGNVFSWLQENVPLFKQVMRWPSSKLNQILLTSISLCGAFGFGYFIDLITSFIQSKSATFSVKLFLLVGFITSQLIFAEYLLSGNLFPKDAFVNIPNEYFELGEYLEENDSEGRIYYAPPSNNNYFREYDWGFNGSQFISYIVPNPLIDLSHSVGSSTNEKATLELSNYFRAADKYSFFEALHKYDVKYLLLDESIILDGFSFDIDLNKSEKLWKDFEPVWKQDFLTLYKVPIKNESLEYSEVLDQNISIQGSFVRNSIQYPTINPLNTKLSDLRIDGDRIIGQFTYQGLTNEYQNNITELDWGSFNTGIKKVDNTLITYPEFPRINEDSRLGITREYQIDNDYDLYIIEDNVVRKSELESNVVVESPFSTKIAIFGLFNNSFQAVDLTQDILLGKGQDCSGESDKSVSILSTEDEGIYMKNDVKLPCIFSNLDLVVDSDFVAKIHLEWEGNEFAYPGICLYSKKLNRCLNQLKYSNSGDEISEIDITIPTIISKDDELSIILYSIFDKGDLVFKKVSLQYTSNFIEISDFITEGESVISKSTLKSGETYEISLPLSRGNKTSIYTPERYPGLIWQPTSDRDDDYSIYISGGMAQEVKDGFVDQSIDLFSPGINNDLLVYFNGNNVSNIPASICVNYLSQEDCWYQNMLEDGNKISNLSYIKSDAVSNKRLGGIFGSTSYHNKTVNILNEFAIAEVPDYWSEIKYIPEKKDLSYSIVEMDKIEGTEAFYSISNINNFENTIVSIPQSVSEGWNAYLLNDSDLINNLPPQIREIVYSIFGRRVSSDVKVKIDGWKQGWDVSRIVSEGYNSLVIVYSPNIYSYVGFLLGIILMIVILLKVIKDLILKIKRGGKK